MALKEIREYLLLLKPLLHDCSSFVVQSQNSFESGGSNLYCYHGFKPES
jgi:hypothetical protein